MERNKSFLRGAILFAALFCGANAFAGDADINLPSLQDVLFLAAA